MEKLQCHPILDLAIAGRARFFADGLSLPKVLLRALVKRLTGTGGRPFRKPPTKRAGLFDCPPAPEGRAIWKALLQKGTLFQKPFLCQGAALLRKPSWRRASFSQSPPALQGEECRKAPGSNRPSGASHVLACRQGNGHGGRPTIWTECLLAHEQGV